MHPRTFQEFHDQFPTIIRQIICKSRWVDFDDVDDLEQEILSELLRSKTVEKFNPDIYEQGANTKLFMQYIKHCATHVFLTAQGKLKRKKRSINNDAVSLTEPVSDRERTTLIGDTIHDNSRAQRAMEAATEFDEFASYLIATDPNLEIIVNAIHELGSTNYKDISEHTGMGQRLVATRMAKFRKLTKVWNAK